MFHQAKGAVLHLQPDRPVHHCGHVHNVQLLSPADIRRADRAEHNRAAVYDCIPQYRFQHATNHLRQHPVAG